MSNSITSTTRLENPSAGWIRINNDDDNFTYQSVTYSNNTNFSSGKAAKINDTPTTALTADKVIEIAFSGTKLRIINQLTNTNDTGNSQSYLALVVLDGKIVDILYDEPTNEETCQIITYQNTDLNDHIHDLQIIVKKGSYQFNFDSIDIDKDANVYNYVLSNDEHKYIIQESIMEDFEKKYPMDDNNFIEGSTIITADYSYWSDTVPGLFSNFRIDQYQEPARIGSADELSPLYSVYGLFDIYDYDNLRYKELYELTKEGLRIKTHVAFDTTSGESSLIDFDNDFKYVVNIDAATASATVYPKDVILVQKHDVDLIDREDISLINSFGFVNHIDDNTYNFYDTLSLKFAISLDKGNTWYVKSGSSYTTLASLSDLLSDSYSLGKDQTVQASSSTLNSLINAVPLKDRGFRIAIRIGIADGNSSNITDYSNITLNPNNYYNFCTNKLFQITLFSNIPTSRLTTETINFFYEYEDNTNETKKIFFADRLIHCNNFLNYMTAIMPSFVKEDPDEYDRIKYQHHYFGSNMKITLPYEEEYKQYVLNDELKYNVSYQQATYLHQKCSNNDLTSTSSYLTIMSDNDNGENNIYGKKMSGTDKTSSALPFRPVIQYSNKWEPTEIESESKSLREVQYTVNNNIEPYENTRILLHFNDANNIFKDAAKNRWKVNGKPNVSNTNAKYINNVNLVAKDYAFMIQPLVIGNDSFTVEGWINISKHVENGRIFSFVTRMHDFIFEAYMGSSNNQIMLRIGDPTSATPVNVITSSDLIGKLNHFAFVYDSTLETPKIITYFNGENQNTDIEITIPETTFTRVAINYDWEGAGYINSKPDYATSEFSLEEFRVSKVARYTENFNPDIGRQFNLGEWEFLPETSRTVENPNYVDLSKIRAFVFSPPDEYFNPPDD